MRYTIAASLALLASFVAGWMTAPQRPSRLEMIHSMQDMSKENYALRMELDTYKEECR